MKTIPACLVLGLWETPSWSFNDISICFIAVVVVVEGPLSGFAIQVNKNSFGFAPKEALVCPDILPGSSADVCVPMAAGQLPSNTPPASPLLLQAGPF